MSSGKVVVGTMGNIDDGLFEIVLINENMLEEVLIFLKDQFFTSEPICKAINAVEKPMLLKDFAKLVTMMITKEGEGSFVSGAVIEKSTNKIISVGCGSLRPKRNNQSYFGEFAEKYCEDDLAKKLLQFLDAATTKVNIYDHFNVDYLIEVNVLVTHENYRRKNFGKKFGDFVVDTVLQQNLSIFLSEYEHVLENFANYAVRAVCTSQFSKRIANKGGCDDLCSTNLSELNLKEYADKFSTSQKVFTVGCKLTKLVLQTYASKY